jgi:hypothetical protein
MNHIDQVCGSATMSILLFHLHFWNFTRERLFN